MMFRTFHSVGQGLFASETHKTSGRDINVVYDCGSISDKKNLKEQIESAFKKDETIDILFISHFDADHINGIEILKKQKRKGTISVPSYPFSLCQPIHGTNNL